MECLRRRPAPVDAKLLQVLCVRLGRTVSSISSRGMRPLLFETEAPQPTTESMRGRPNPHRWQSSVDPNQRVQRQSRKAASGSWLCENEI